MKDFYKILAVPASSTLPEIKKAYRSLSKKYHPDLNPGNLAFEEKFKALQEAYSVLKDPLKRRAFDDKLEAKRAAKTLNNTIVNNLKPHPHPPFSYKDSRKQNPTKRKPNKRVIQKKDLYFGGGIILFLFIVVATIIILESKYSDNESNFDTIDTSYKQPSLDSLHLIRGYQPDSVVAD